MPAGDELTSAQLRRLDEAVAAAMAQTGLVFSVFVGDVVEVLPDGDGMDLDADAPTGKMGEPVVEEQQSRGRADGLRGTAERLHAALADRADEAVFLLVAPGQRRLEIVTGSSARRRVPDRACALAALSMTSSFGGGDLVGGVVQGLRMLADTASSHR